MAETDITPHFPPPLGLSPAETDALLKEFGEVLHENVDETLGRMQDQFGKIVLNSDDLFKMLPRYRDNPPERIVLGPLLYEPAARFTDEVYDRLLSQPAGADDTVVFTAGGSATGKSTILRAAGERPGVDFIIDTTFSSERWALSQVEKALASRRKVEIHYVYRNFAASVQSMLERALDPKSGRIVPVDDMARTHFGAQRAVLAALMRYCADGMVSILLNANESGGRLTELSEKEFAKRLHPAVDKLQEAGQAVLDDFYREHRARRNHRGGDQNSRGKHLQVSEDFYEAARSKAQGRRKAPGEGNA